MNQYIYMPDNHSTENNYINQLFEHHRIPGFLNYEIRTINDNKYIYYRIRYKTTLAVFMENMVCDDNKILQIISGIIYIMEISREYLLDYNRIIWSPDCIFIEIETGNMMFCYYPDNLEGNDIREFLTKLIQYAGKKNEESSVMIIQFYNCITDPFFDMNKLKDFKEKYILKQKKIYYDEPVERPDKMEEEDDRCSEHEEEKKEILAGGIMNIIIFVMGIANIVIIFLFVFQVIPYKYLPVMFVSLGILVTFLLMNPSFTKEENPDEIMEAYLKEEKNRIMNEDNVEKQACIIYGETSILSEYNMEQIVVEERRKELILTPVKKDKYKPVIPLEQGVVIGCMKENCDYVLAEREISRLHAKLYKKNFELYLLDLNSTNGTYLNGEQIICGKEYLLEEGDMVAFSRIEFYVTDKAF